MGVAVRNLESDGGSFTGTGVNQTIPHKFNSIPSSVIFTPKSATANPYLVSKGQNSIVVLAVAAQEFDVLIIK